MAAIDRLADLADYLRLIEQADEREDDTARNATVLQALALAARNGFAVGFRLDPAAPAWPVAYIELPDGQVSWHLPQHERAWDGHDTAAKYRRCRAFRARYEG